MSKHPAATTLPAAASHTGMPGQGTTPGSFARPWTPGEPLTFSSPDTPEMPAPATQTAGDFMPTDWRLGEDGRWRARSRAP